MGNLSFAEKLASATNEDKQVNPIYVGAISAGLKRLNAGMEADNPKYDLYTDGVFDCWYTDDNGHKEWFILQLECKQDIDLNESKQLAKVIIQVCFYIASFEAKGLEKPKIAVIGTKKNCIAIPVKYLYESYIQGRSYPGTGLWKDDSYVGKISASKAGDHELYEPIKTLIANDAKLSTFARIIEVSDKYAVDDICKDILKVAKDINKGCLFITDSLQTYETVAQFENIDHVAIPSDKHAKDGYNLGTINSIHSQMSKDWSKSEERIPSTKYLPQYIALFIWRWTHKDMPYSERIQLMEKTLIQGYEDYASDYSAIKQRPFTINTKGKFKNTDV